MFLALKGSISAFLEKGDSGQHGHGRVYEHGRVFEHTHVSRASSALPKSC